MNLPNIFESIFRTFCSTISNIKSFFFNRSIFHLFLIVPLFLQFFHLIQRRYSRTPNMERPAHETASPDQCPRSAITRVHNRNSTPSGGRAKSNANTRTPKRTRMRDTVPGTFSFRDVTPTRSRSSSRHLRSPSPGKMKKPSSVDSQANNFSNDGAKFAKPATKHADLDLDNLTEEQLIKRMLADPSLYKEIKKLVRAKEKEEAVDQKRLLCIIPKPPLAPRRQR